MKLWGGFLGFVVGFPVVFEHVVFAFEAALGGGEIAEDEVVGLDFVGFPGGDGGTAVEGEVAVVFTLGAEAHPFGLCGFHDKGVEEGGIGGGLVGFEPGLKKMEPVGLRFVDHDEGFGAHPVAGGVAGGGLAAFKAGRTGVAGIAFLSVFWMSVLLISSGGFVRIGVEVFRGLGGIGNLVFVEHCFSDFMVVRGVRERNAKVR
jgi:hypothetical protein